MPSAHRYCLPGHALHITHRSHKIGFLFESSVLEREPIWSDCIAVGSQAHVNHV